MYYYLSIGTNIEPEKNAVNIITHLTQEFGPLAVYPFIYTYPEAIESKRIFLNSLAIIVAKHSPAEVKSRLNLIEERLGRDRSDPARSSKDRAADIDILDYGEALDVNVFQRGKEAYISQVVAGHGVAADLGSQGLVTPERPTTVHFDASTGHIAIFQDGTCSLENRLKTSLLGK